VTIATIVEQCRHAVLWLMREGPVRGAPTPVVALPTSAISYAPYGNSVFIVGQMKGPDGKTYSGVRQQFVKLGASRGDVFRLFWIQTLQVCLTEGVIGILGALIGVLWGLTYWSDQADFSHSRVDGGSPML